LEPSGTLRIKHPEFQEGIQENAKVHCSGQASPGNCLLQRRENQNLFPTWLAGFK
jgi:hypothetical protein